MPNPLLPPIYLTESNFICVVTPAYVLIIDKKTGKVVGVVPEMPMLGGDVFTAAVDFLHKTEGLKEAAELRFEAEKFVVNYVQKAVQSVTVKAERAAA